MFLLFIAATDPKPQTAETKYVTFEQVFSADMVTPSYFAAAFTFSALATDFKIFSLLAFTSKYNTPVYCLTNAATIAAVKCYFRPSSYWKWAAYFTGFKTLAYFGSLFLHSSGARALEVHAAEIPRTFEVSNAFRAVLQDNVKENLNPSSSVHNSKLSTSPSKPLVCPIQGSSDHAPDTTEVFGFSCMIDTFTWFHEKMFEWLIGETLTQKISRCAEKGIAVVIAGNDGDNMQTIADGNSSKKTQFSPKVYRDILSIAQHNPRVMIVGGYWDGTPSEWDAIANNLTSEQIERSNVLFIRAPIAYLINGQWVAGTSNGQSYVSNILLTLKQQYSGHQPEAYNLALFKWAKAKNNYKVPMPDGLTDAFYDVVAQNLPRKIDQGLNS
ncbi:MAG: hypothetical protein H6850_01960 [Alphaproteobacteria bacterium]|nr:MAG: hypothetical protein H6850_01960 [Alphaproteobacteria bacterium]